MKFTSGHSSSRRCASSRASWRSLVCQWTAAALALPRSSGRCASALSSTGNSRSNRPRFSHSISPVMTLSASAGRRHLSNSSVLQAAEMFACCSKNARASCTGKKNQCQRKRMFLYLEILTCAAVASAASAVASSSGTPSTPSGHTTAFIAPGVIIDHSARTIRLLIRFLLAVSKNGL